MEQILALEPTGVRRGVEAVGYEARLPNGTIDASITLRQLVNVTANQGGIGFVGLQNNGTFNFDIGTVFNKAITLQGVSFCLCRKLLLSLCHSSLLEEQIPVSSSVVLSILKTHRSFMLGSLGMKRAR